MNIKQIIGFVILVIGIIFAIFSIRSTNHPMTEKGPTQVIRPFRSSTTAREVGNSLFQREALPRQGWDHKWSLIGGIVLAIIGSAAFCIYRRR